LVLNGPTFEVVWAQLGAQFPTTNQPRRPPLAALRRRNDHEVDRSATSCDHQIQCKLDEDMMLDIANDIRSLSDFKRNTVHLLDRIRKTGNPMVLTVNGKAELVVQDAEAYQALLDRIETIEGIQRGLADVKAGRTKPAPQVFARLRRKHGISR
jgi:prevent-host-death family protein